MRKIKLYIAVSLDGFIATPSGDVDWLCEIPNPNGIDHGRKEFLESIDTILMGGKTFNKITSFGDKWPYKKKTYVVAHHNTNFLKNEDIHFITEDLYNTIKHIKDEEGKDIGLVGGGELTSILLNCDLLDEIQLCYVPILLGKGIPLFSNNIAKSYWILKNSNSYDTGILVNIYKKSQIKR